MLNDLFSSHLTNLQHALDQTSQRQTLLMRNMANVNVAGYKRQDITFNVALADQMSEQHKMDLQGMRDQQASDQTSIRQDGNNVDMEREVASITETSLHFEALSDFTSSYFSSLKSVIKEGK